MSGKVRLYVDGAYIHNGTEVWVHDQCGESVLFRELADSRRAEACLNVVWEMLDEYPNVAIVDGLLQPV